MRSHPVLGSRSSSNPGWIVARFQACLIPKVSERILIRPADESLGQWIADVSRVRVSMIVDVRPVEVMIHRCRSRHAAATFRKSASSRWRHGLVPNGNK